MEIDAGLLEIIEGLVDLFVYRVAGAPQILPLPPFLDYTWHLLLLKLRVLVFKIKDPLFPVHYLIFEDPDVLGPLLDLTLEL